jgi:Transposase DDE domain
LDAFSFLALMTVGQAGMKHPSLAGMVDAIPVSMTREAMHERFTPQAEAFLETCLQHALKRGVNNDRPIKTALLNPFKRVLIFDSSSWDVDPHLADVLPGSGGGASTANCKLQVGYEYRHGELGFFKIDPGTRPDNAYTTQLPSILQAGDLALFDQGYFKLETLSEIANKGAFFLTRFLVKTTIREAGTSTPIELEDALYRLPEDRHQFQAVMGGRNGTPEVKCRLICLRVSEQVANERRRRLLKEAKRKGRTPSNTHLALCDWTLLVTNVSEKSLPLEMAWRLYSLRWQIELLFKQLKSVLAIHRSPIRKNFSRLKCEIYGKLILAVLVQRIHADLNNLFWNRAHRELSFDKFYKRIQERAFAILHQLLLSVPMAVQYLSAEIRSVVNNCFKLQQRSRQTTLQSLEGNTGQEVKMRPTEFLT